MKKLFVLLFSFYSFWLLGQSPPSGVNYQGVFYDSAGSPVDNQNIEVLISIHSGSAAGPEVWEETHVTTTDVQGHFSLIIGQGQPTVNGQPGSLSDVPWGQSSHYLQTEIRPGGSNGAYADMGTQTIQSVFYALNAGSGGSWSIADSSGAIYNLNSGSVGIGVSSPAEELDVSGQLKLSSDSSPGVPSGGTGTVRWNASTHCLEVYTGGGWLLLGDKTHTYLNDGF